MVMLAVVVIKASSFYYYEFLSPEPRGRVFLKMQRRVRLSDGGGSFHWHVRNCSLHQPHMLHTFWELLSELDKTKILRITPAGAEVLL